MINMKKNNLGIYIGVNVFQFLGTLLFSVASFALSISLLRETGSLWSYVFNALFVSSITAIIGPFSGLIVDKIGRAKTACIVGSLCMLSGLVGYADTGNIDILFNAALISISNSVAMSVLSVIATSTPKMIYDDLAKAGKMLSSIQISDQCARVISPLLLFFLYPLNLDKIALVSALVGALIVVFSLLIFSHLKITEKSNYSEKEEDEKYTIRDMLKLLYTDKTLRIFAPFLAITTAAFELSIIVLNPIFLSFSDEKTLGVAFTIANGFAVLGGICIAKVGKKWSKNFAINIFILIEMVGAILIAIESQTSSPIVYISALAIGFFIMPASLVAAQIIWLGDTPKEHQGLVSGLERFASWVLVPFAYVLAPVMANGITDPQDIVIFREMALVASGVIMLTCIATILFRFSTKTKNIPQTIS